MNTALRTATWIGRSVLADGPLHSSNPLPAFLGPGLQLLGHRAFTATSTAKSVLSLWTFDEDDVLESSGDCGGPGLMDASVRPCSIVVTSTKLGRLSASRWMQRRARAERPAAAGRGH
eukprot:CAMPEP_0194759844 /NCGR_PEP_ID=MMETSP0323_2-20130528/12836_1 /TAXON_ID=2866 ORGANISM="Crypthecodinium cohnii, Strain Seligo" /NCGR_SAMPLE_ID=MMETSP0323_2 /ASSEMBLY_ACC=CAM_ASM_000346 /LENGTH=117 /DNA_ID=CAMNT_0039680791 /DNA_START=688 /DNA_END=1042 /DNA_ORIENTATION=-